MYTTQKYGDYIVYVDESGDHNLKQINREYPIFVLSFCIFHIPAYTDKIVPEIQRMKFKYFGHDMAVFHETEIRKQESAFRILRNDKIRKVFMHDLSRIIHQSSFKIVASIINKNRYKQHVRAHENPYHVALEYGLERVFEYLQALGQVGRLTYIVFEGRGKNEDADLKLEFSKILDRTTINGMSDTLRFKCVSKLSNSTGLQLADMTARPIGLRILRPQQQNRAWDLIKSKILTEPNTKMINFGLKVYP